MANRYANLVGSNKIKDEWQKINTGFDLVQQDVDAEVAAREELEERVDNIIAGGSEDKDPELVDIRYPDPSYTPGRTINVAGDVTRDMQAQFMSHKAETTSWQRYKLTGDDGLGKGGFYGGDLNDLVDTGIYSVSSATNRPVEVIGICIVIRRSASHLQQMYATVTSSASSRDRVFLRTSTDTGATWTDWVELINSNGGTMIGSLTIDGGTLYRSFAVRREVSGEPHTSDLGVTVFGEAQVRRLVNGVVDGVIRIEGAGKYNFDGTKFYIGAGAPEGAVTAPQGSLYLRTDGSTSTTLYVKTSGTGNTGWTAK